MASTKARGDMGFAGPSCLLVMVGTVVLMPMMAPLLITGVTFSTWRSPNRSSSLMLLPLIIGAAIRHLLRDKAATTIFPRGQGAGPDLHRC